MRKGCKGVAPIQPLKDNEKDFLKHLQEKIDSFSDEKDIMFWINHVSELVYKLENSKELFSNFINQIKRYIYFYECKDLKENLEKELVINPKFVEFLQKGRLNFTPFKIRLRFPSQKTSFSTPIVRDNYLVARGSDGLVRIWKRIKSEWLLINEVGEKGTGIAPIELFNKDYLFYAKENTLIVYNFKNGKVVCSQECPKKITGLLKVNNGIKANFENEAALINFENSKLSAWPCEPFKVDEKQIMINNLIYGDIYYKEGKIYHIPDLIINYNEEEDKLIIGDNLVLEDNIKNSIVDFYLEFSLKPDTNKYKIINYMKETYNKETNTHIYKFKFPLNLKAFFISVFYNFSQNIALNLLQKLLKNNYIKILSENPEVEYYGFRGFDDYLIFAVKDRTLRIYNRDGDEKITIKNENFIEEEFNNNLGDIKLRIFPDGFLIQKDDKFYGSKNWKDYIYLVDGDNVFFPDEDDYKDFFDYAESVELFDELVKKGISKEIKQEQKDDGKSVA